MRIEVLPDGAAVAHAAAALIAREARAAVTSRGRFVLALSGGRTPWPMLRALAGENVPWPAVQIFQVDERIAPAGDPDRNLTRLQENLLSLAPIAASQIHPMPVEAGDLADAVLRYASVLRAVAGSPPTLDLIHLGLGADGHTASLVPDDPVLDVSDADVGLAGPYQGHPRMTLTYPILNRARQLLWVVSGPEKAQMLLRLCHGDATIPAGRVTQTNARVLADRAAARMIEATGGPHAP
ncbi:MAG: 6-phosphogluconolactonase [Betaproteobacteria bacterium]